MTIAISIGSFEFSKKNHFPAPIKEVFIAVKFVAVNYKIFGLLLL
jgi:hypothetical protein